MSECGLPASREVAACGVSHPRTESPRVGASLPVGRRYGGRIIIDRQPLSGGATLVLMQIGGDHRILSVLRRGSSYCRSMCKLGGRPSVYHRPAPCVLPRSSSSGASCWSVPSPARRPRARPRGRRRAPGGTSAGASARIGPPIWTRRVGIWTRSAIRRTRVSMWTLFPRSQATAGGTTSSRTSARRSSFRPAGCSIAHA